MNWRDRFKENFERNKAAALAKHRAPKKTRWPLFVAAAGILGGVLLLPERMASFIGNSLQLGETFQAAWLKPKRWDGLYSLNPEGYVDVADMRLDHESEIYFSLYYDPEFGVFDGEVISNTFCEAGFPYANILFEGHQRWLFRNQMRIDAFELVGGTRVELGSFSAVLDGSVVEISGGPFGESLRLGRDSYKDRDELPTLCGQ